MTCSGCASPTGNWEAGWGVDDGASLYLGVRKPVLELRPHHAPSRRPCLVRACSPEGILALPASTTDGEVSGLVTVKRAPAAADRGDVEGPWGCPLAPMGTGVWRVSEHRPCWDAALLRTLPCLCAPPAGPSHLMTWTTMRNISLS